MAKLLVVETVGFVPHFVSEEKTPRSHKYLASDIQSFSGMKTVALNGSESGKKSLYEKMRNLVSDEKK